MNKYIVIFIVQLKSILAYRAKFYLSAISNIVYIFIVYFLWKAIYKGADNTINGMTFYQTFFYLASASTMFNVFKTWSEWKISYHVLSGDILRYITKPIDFQLIIFSESTALATFNFICIGVPIFVVIGFISSTEPIIIGRLSYIVITFLLSYIISFQIDYITGITAFYTESVWGISLTKESIVLLLSGALVPLSFFPAWLAETMTYFPFLYIYHAPINILMSKGVSLAHFCETIAMQSLWIVILLLISRLFYRYSIRELTINGG